VRTSPTSAPSGAPLCCSIHCGGSGTSIPSAATESRSTWPRQNQTAASCSANRWVSSWHRWCFPAPGTPPNCGDDRYSDALAHHRRPGTFRPRTAVTPSAASQAPPRSPDVSHMGLRDAPTLRRTRTKAAPAATLDRAPTTAIRTQVYRGKPAPLDGRMSSHSPTL